MGLMSFLEKKVSLADLGKELETIVGNIADQIYFKELALQIAISYIANTISKCEFKVYENGKEVHNKLYYMLNVNPNPNQSSSQFWNALVTRYYRNGEALVVPDTERGRIYLAQSFARDEKPTAEDIFSTISLGAETLKRKYKASDVFYFRLDDMKLKALIDGAFQQYGQVMQSAIDSFIRRSGRKYKLALDQYKAGDPNFAEIYNNYIKKQLEAFVKSPNAVYPQFKGTDLQVLEARDGGSAQTGMSADIVAMRKEIFDTTAQAIKIPLSMMYGNITNIKDITNVFLTITIDPFADMISEELTRKSYSFDTWSRGNFVKCDTSCISHVDILDVADKVNQAVSSGVVRIDEVRKRLDYDPYGDEFGQMRFVTRNYATIYEVMQSENNLNS